MPADSPDSELPFSLRGQLLLAAPALSDGTFDHSVIILADHSATEGAFGMIINHPSQATVEDLVPNLANTSLAQVPVYRGGPLSTDELTFSSFAWSEKNGLAYLPRISAQAARAMVGKPDHIVHATVGHSAWSPGQLESELKANAWITARPSITLLSEPHDLTLWKTLLKTISPYHDLLSQAPKNPLLN